MNEISFVISEQWKQGEVDDVFFLDHIFNTTNIELKPRVYRGDWGQLVWCVEVTDWLANKHIMNLVNFPTRREALHQALVWYYDKHCVKNS